MLDGGLERMSIGLDTHSVLGRQNVLSCSEDCKELLRPVAKIHEVQTMLLL